MESNLFWGVLLWVGLSTVEGHELGDRGHNENMLAGNLLPYVCACKSLSCYDVVI